MNKKDKHSRFNPENKKNMENFIKQCKINDKSEKTIECYKSYLLKYARFLENKKFENATEMDVQQFFKEINLAKSSIQTMKIILKLFYRFIFKLEVGERLPDSVRWLKSKSQRQKIKEINIEEEKKKVITLEEYQKLMEYTSDAQLKAIMEIGYWYGSRLGETLSMNVNGVKRKDEGTEITVQESKTKSREILVLDAEYYPTHLMNWLDMHPDKKNPDSPLFINLNTDHRVYGKRLTVNNIDRKIERLCRNVFGSDRKIISHMLRHTAITRDCSSGMPWTHVCTKYGLSKNSRMKEVYDHSGHDEFVNWMKSRYDVEEGETKSRNELLKQNELLVKEKDQDMQKIQSEVRELQEVLSDIEGKIERLGGLIKDGSVLSKKIKRAVGKT